MSDIFTSKKYNPKSEVVKKDHRGSVRKYVNESKGSMQDEVNKLEDKYFGKGLKQNPAQLGQFPYYYYSLGHLNKERQLKHKMRSQYNLMQDQPDGYVYGAYEKLLRETTVFKVPLKITNSLLRTKLPNDLNRHQEIRLPKDNIFIESTVKLDYRKYDCNIFGIHILDSPLTNLTRIKNPNLFERIIETTTFDGKKFTDVKQLFDFIDKCGNLRAFKVIHVETHPSQYINTVQNIHILWKPEHKVVDRLRGPEKVMRDFIFNYVLFVNNPEVDFIYRETPVKANQKRLAQGRIPKPDYAVIKLKGQLKKVVNQTPSFSSGKKNRAHEVRGHWRNFYNDKYTNMKGKRRWIYPFVRGEGIAVSRNYEHI